MISFTCDARELAGAVKWAALARAGRPVVPVLGGMRVEVTAGAVTVACFDYDMSARSSVAADGTAAGVVLADGGQLITAARNLPAGRGARVTGSVAGGSLVLASGGVTASVALLDMDEYPALPVMPAAAGTVAAGDFAAAVARVTVCAGKDVTLPVLLCARLSFGDGELRLAATDRYRLACDTVPFTAAGGVAGREVNVPAVALAKFAALAGRDNGKVTVCLSEEADDVARCGFSDGTRELTIRAGDGQFPAVDQIWPSAEFPASAVADSGALGAAVKRAGKATGKNEAVRLDFGTPGAVTVTAVRDGQAASSETVACEHDTAGAPPVIGFNPAYLASVLAGAGAGPARLGWKANGGIVTVAPDAGGTWRGIVMQIRLAA